MRYYEFKIKEALVPPDTTSTRQLKLFDPEDVDADYNMATGKGAFMIGREKEDDPHTFIKKAIYLSNASDDPQFLFYQAIENQKGDNPWLPVVYKTNVVKDPEELKQRSDYQMETLQKVSAVPEDFLFHFTLNLPKLFPKVNTSLFYDRINERYEDLKYLEEKLGERIEKMNKDLNEPGISPQEEKSLKFHLRSAKWHIEEALSSFKNECVKSIMYHIEEVISGNLTSTDKNLNNAGKIVKQVLDSNKDFELDFYRKGDPNTDNLLWRGTKTGFQPVISDPIANLKLTFFSPTNSIFSV